MKKIFLILGFMAILSFASSLSAQQLDLAFDISTLHTAGTSSTGNPGMGGGFYPAFSAGYIFKNRLGLQGEVAWRGKINPTFGYRPILFSLNGVFAPKINDRVTFVGLAGIGFEGVRLYTGTYNCNYFGCTNYNTDKHFLTDLGAGVRFYATKNVFVQPEVRWYYVPNQDNLFSTNSSTRYGISLGYTFGTEE